MTMKTKPGCYLDIPWEDYDQIEAVNWSALSKGDHHPGLVVAYMNRRFKTAPTPEMIFGRAIHAAVLEPEKFAKEWTILEKEDQKSTSKDGHVTMRGARSIGGMIDALKKSSDWEDGQKPTPRSLFFEDCDTEVTLVWEDESGLLCKARIDSLPKTGPWFGDLKSSASVDLNYLSRDIVSRQYYGQMAYYMMGIQAVFGEIRRPALVALGKVYPYPWSMVCMDQDFIDKGMTLCRMRLDQYQYHIEDPIVHQRPVSRYYELAPPAWLTSPGESPGQVNGELCDVTF